MTLIELVVAIAIILVLATISVPFYLTYGKKAKTAEARLGLTAIRKLENSYRAEHGTFSNDLNVIGFTFVTDPLYSYSILDAGAVTFSAQATANLDGDAVLDSWIINQAGQLSHDVID